MSIKLVTDIIETEYLELSGGDKLVLLVLASWAKDDGTDIRPAISSIARRCGFSRDTVYEHIYRLVAFGILIDTEEDHFYGKGHYTNIYQINLSALSGFSTVSGNSTVSKRPGARVEKRRSAVSKRRTQIRPIIPSQPSADSVLSVSKSVSQLTPSSPSADSALSSPDLLEGTGLHDLQQMLTMNFHSEVSAQDTMAVAQACSWMCDATNRQIVSVLEEVLLYAFDHAFWKTRVLSAQKFATALAREDEKGLYAQYERHKDKQERKPVRRRA